MDETRAGVVYAYAHYACKRHIINTHPKYIRISTKIHKPPQTCMCAHTHTIHCTQHTTKGQGRKIESYRTTRAYQLVTYLTVDKLTILKADRILQDVLEV